MKETIIPKIEVRHGSITTLVVDAIVNPANSFGYMGGGVAGAIKKIGGQEIEEEAVEQAPIQVGTAVKTTHGLLPCKAIIHAPTMHNPAERTDAHKVKCAVEAALELADSEEFRSLAIPGMGTGVGGLDKNEAAQITVSAIKSAEFIHVEKIILIDTDEKMIEAFKRALSSVSRVS